jgi:3-hexulose-6-phosphate synthase
MDCDVYLQVALDYTVLEDAVKLASILPGEKWVILEAGTPLVKSEGARSISLIKAIARERMVVADLKTMDTGGLEASLAFDHGADITTVLAAAPDETIKSAVREAGKRGKIVMADLIGLPDPLSAVQRLEDLGVDIILFHIGIDVQQAKSVTASSRSELVRRLARETGKARIAVAGGIKPGEAGVLKEAGADIIIIGSAITRSLQPLREIEVFKQQARPSCR